MCVIPAIDFEIIKKDILRILPCLFVILAPFVAFLPQCSLLSGLFITNAQNLFAISFSHKSNFLSGKDTL